jgi:hypothetical protein
MKRITLSLLSLLLVTSSFAQFYVRVSAGYNLPAASQQIGEDRVSVYNANTGQYEVTLKGIYGTLGSGVAAHVAFGGQLKNGILGYDVDFGYVKGKGYETRNRNESGSYYDEASTSYNSNSIQISPSLTFTTGTGNFQPFARLGPTFAISSVTTETIDFNSYYVFTDVLEYEYTGGVNVGLKGVVGCSYQLNEKLKMYLEADFVSVAYAPKKRTMTRNEQNGVDNLPTTDPKYVTIEYEKEQTSTDYYNLQVRPTFPMSSIGFELGVQFSF